MSQQVQFSSQALLLATALFGAGILTVSCIPFVVGVEKWTALSLAAVYQFFLTVAGILFGGALAFVLQRPKTCIAAGVAITSLGGWIWAAVWVVLYFRM
ncbi:MAG TPA: hypothetical protein VHC22_23270 [Pirellulales bacterium]|nr:hypothetical protein [Pirellulales bacterium]